MIVKQLGYRVAALHSGFRAEYQLWWYGIAVGLIITVLSKGKVWVFVPGAVMIHHLVIHRLGYFRYGSNVRHEHDCSRKQHSINPLWRFF